MIKRSRIWLREWLPEQCGNQGPGQRARWVKHMDPDIIQGDGQTWISKDCESIASFKLFSDL